MILEDSDVIMQANALWALTNLCWCPMNQERVGRYLKEVCVFLSASTSAVQRQAYTLLSNVLYYSESNRSRFLRVEGTVEILLSTYCYINVYVTIAFCFATSHLMSLSFSVIYSISFNVIEPPFFPSNFL